MPIQLAVFDIAGTTVADQHAVADAFMAAFLEFGYDSVSLEDVKPLMGYKKPLAIETVLRNLGVAVDESQIQAIHEAFVKLMLAHYEQSPDVRGMPAAEDVFRQLKQKGIRIALNTGFSRNIADTIVDRLHWKEKGLVDDYIASDEVEAGRPAPFMIRSLMQRAGVTSAGDVIKVGDTEVDINEGRNAGCSMVVAVTTGAFSREQLAAYRPDHIIDDLAQLPALID